MTEFLRSLLPLLILLLIPGVVLLAALLWAWARHERRRLWQRTGMVELKNQGNTRVTFELLADDPLDAFRFQFRLNGAPLSFRMDTVTRAVTPAASSAPAGRPALAAPAPNGSGGAGANLMDQARDVLVGLVEAGGDLIPGRLGSGLHELGWRLRQGERNVGRLHRAVRPGSDGPFASPAPKRAAAAAPQTAAQPQATIETQMAPTLWAQTPPVEPGEIIHVQLLVNPRQAPRQEMYAFRVQARLANVPEAAPMQEQGRLVYPPLAWHRQYLPWIVVGLATVVILVLVWVLLSSLGI